MQNNPYIFSHAGGEIDFSYLQTSKDIENLYDEYRESLNHFVQDAGIQRLYKYPNYNPGGLLGHQGYVAMVHTSKTFSSWMFLQQMFGCISVFEVEYIQNVNEFCRSDIKKDSIRKSIQITTPNFPNLTDTVESPWTPALGYNGGLIGCYRFQEKGQNDQVFKDFIIVHSYLHYQTCRLILDELMNITYTNQELGSKLNLDTTNKTERSIGSVLSDSLLNKGRALSKENNRRLATQYAKILGLKFVDVETKILLTPSRTSENPFHNDPIYADLAKEALNWWPQNVPLYIDTMIEYDIEDEEIDDSIYKRLKVSNGVVGLPIGVLFNATKKALSNDALKSFNEKYKAVIIEKRETVQPVAECDFNTFRLLGDYAYIYNNCTCTRPSPKEPMFHVIRQLSLTKGYEIYNSCISIHNKEKHIEEYTKWTNDYGDGFPVVYPQIKRESRNENTIKFNADTMNIFFSYFTGSSSTEEGENRKIPKQLQYVPRNSNQDESIFKKDLYPPDFNPNVVQLLPLFVYLSPDIALDSNKISP